jgi:2Fe-2S ferredoxin
MGRSGVSDVVKVIFETHKGVVREVDAEAGRSVMEAAIGNMVNGILGDCGGSCSCATCHVYVDPTWFTRLEPATATETELLDMAIDPNETSRLSCQIKLTPELDGLHVRLPVSQI